MKLSFKILKIYVFFVSLLLSTIPSVSLANLQIKCEMLFLVNEDKSIKNLNDTIILSIKGIEGIQTQKPDLTINLVSDTDDNYVGSYEFPLFGGKGLYTFIIGKNDKKYFQEFLLMPKGASFYSKDPIWTKYGFCHN